MNKKKTKQVKQETKNVDKSSDNNLENLKQSINKKYDDIEHTFYLIGLDLIKVNMMVKNFRKWVKQNTRIDVSTAYTLMRLVKRDTELCDNKKYKTVRPKICLTKLVKLLKYPADFVDNLDFEKEYELPGGKMVTLIEMPTDNFSEVIAHENKKQNTKNTDDDEDNIDSNVPMNNTLILKAKDKLDKLLNELQTVFTVLSEITVDKDSKDTVKDAVEELESINTQTESISTVVTKLLSTLKKPLGKGKRKVA